jgi:hypothetical protein
VDSEEAIWRANAELRMPKRLSHRIHRKLLRLKLQKFQLVQHKQLRLQSVARKCAQVLQHDTSLSRIVFTCTRKFHMSVLP